MQNEELSMQRLSGDEEESGDEPQPVVPAQEGAKPDSASGGAKRRRIMHVPNLDVGRPNQPNKPPAPVTPPKEVVCLEVMELTPSEDGAGASEVNNASGSCIGYALVLRDPDEGVQVVEAFGYVPPAVEPEDPKDEESDSTTGPSNADEASAKPEPADDDAKEMILEEIMKCIVAAYDRAVSIPDQE